MKKIDRYPGPRPFDESESHLFFGRSQETDALFDMVCAYPVVVVHAESGLGKSSLISAGLIPKLKENAYVPLLIRFRQRNEPPLEQLLDGIRKTAPTVQSGFQEHQGEGNLWQWIKWYNKHKLTPVLVFDQFEEFFYFEQSARLEVVKAFSTALGTKVPVTVIETVTLGDEETQSSFQWYTQPDFRVLFSLRSDRLGLMEELARYVPAILKNRYQLKPISSDRSEQAIVVPAILEPFDEIAFNSDPFEYEEALVESISKVVKDNRRNTVETTQLQMICQEIENIARSQSTNSAQGRVITLAHVKGEEGLQQLVKNFYKKQLDRIRQDPAISYHEYRVLRKLIEKKLIVGKKRVLLASDVVREYFYRHYIDVTQTTYLLDVLLNRRLVRDQTYGDSDFYEISHDTFIEPILAEKNKRELGEKLAREKKEAERAAQAEKERLEQEQARQQQEKEALEWEQARQQEEIERQKRYIKQIEAERNRAEAAEKTTKEVWEEALKAEQAAILSAQQARRNEKIAKDNEKIAKDNADIANEALKSLQKARKRNILLGGFAFAFLLNGLFYFYWENNQKGERNEQIKEQLVKISNYEANNQYDKGNHVLANALWQNALRLKPSDSAAAVIKTDLQNKMFSPFAGGNIELSQDLRYIATKYKNSELIVWTKGSNGQYTQVLDVGRVDQFGFLGTPDVLWCTDDSARIAVHDLKSGSQIKLSSTTVRMDTIKVSGAEQFDSTLALINLETYPYYLFFNIEEKYENTLGRRAYKVQCRELSNLNQRISSIFADIQKNSASSNDTDYYVFWPELLSGQDSTSICLRVDSRLYSIDKTTGKYSWYELPSDVNRPALSADQTKFAYIKNEKLFIENLGMKRKASSINTSVYSKPEFTQFSFYSFIEFCYNDSLLLLSSLGRQGQMDQYIFKIYTGELHPFPEQLNKAMTARPPRRGVRRVRWSNDKRHLFVPGTEGTLSIFDMYSLKEVYSSPKVDYFVIDEVWQMALVDDNDIILLDLKTLKVKSLAVKVPPGYKLDSVYSSEYLRFTQQDSGWSILLHQDSTLNTTSSIQQQFKAYIEESLDQIGVRAK